MEKIVNKIDVKDYLNIYKEVGFKIIHSEKTIKKSLKESTFVIGYVKDFKLVGMIRCISDKNTIFFLQDLAVLPSYQNQQIGKKLFQEALNKINKISNNQRGMIVLVSTKDNESFYEQFGFHKVPYNNLGNAMIKTLKTTTN